MPYASFIGNQVGNGCGIEFRGKGKIELAAWLPKSSRAKVFLLMARSCRLGRCSKSAAYLSGYAGHQINVVVTAARDPIDISIARDCSHCKSREAIVH
jgi:hypothetical protein